MTTDNTELVVHKNTHSSCNNKFYVKANNNMAYSIRPILASFIAEITTVILFTNHFVFIV